MTAQIRTPRGVPTGGEFAAHDRADAERPLALLATTTSGLEVTVTPGVLDDHANAFYTQGQCLALAVAIAEADGADIVHVELIDDEITGKRRLLHAFAYGEDDQLIDVDGAIDSAVRDDELHARDAEAYTQTWTVAEARAYRPVTLPEQRFDLAATHAPIVLEKLR